MLLPTLMMSLFIMTPGSSIFSGWGGGAQVTDFIPAFSELTSPMTDLNRKGASDPVQWTEQCQMAFERFKRALCGVPLLHIPHFKLPFVLQTNVLNRRPFCLYFSPAFLFSLCLVIIRVSYRLSYCPALLSISQVCF